VVEHSLGFLKQQAPFVATAEEAVDAQLLELSKLLAIFCSGLGYIADCLRELTHTQYWRWQLTLYSYIAWPISYGMMPRKRMQLLLQLDVGQTMQLGHVLNCAGAQQSGVHCG
jgi:hypothetical protein